MEDVQDNEVESLTWEESIDFCKCIISCIIPYSQTILCRQRCHFRKHHDFVIHSTWLCITQHVQARLRKARLSLFLTGRGRQLCPELLRRQGASLFLPSACLISTGGYVRGWCKMTLFFAQRSSPAISSRQQLTWLWLRWRWRSCSAVAAPAPARAAENLRTWEPQSSESSKLPIQKHAASFCFTVRHSSMAQILGKLTQTMHPLSINLPILSTKITVSSMSMSG